METNEIMECEQKLVFVLLGNGMEINEAFGVASLNERLQDQLRNGVAHFVYKKIDGTFRNAIGTLSTRLIERSQRGKGIRKVKNTTQVFFDVEKNEWRSFKVENLIGIF